MAVASAVAAGIKRRPGVAYTALWLNKWGLQRVLAADNLDVFGTIGLCPSPGFLLPNQSGPPSKTMKHSGPFSRCISAMTSLCALVV